MADRYYQGGPPPRQNGANLPPERTLTDADIEAIVGLLKKQLVRDFYGEVGKGVSLWIMKVLIGIGLAWAAYGLSHNAMPATQPPGIRP